VEREEKKKISEKKKRRRRGGNSKFLFSLVSSTRAMDGKPSKDQKKIGKNKE